MTNGSPAIAATRPQGRARVSNGSKLLTGVDGRSSAARRLRDLQDQLLAELGDVPSQRDMILAREAAWLSLTSEQQQAALARGAPVDVATMVTTTNALRRVLDNLGRRRRRRSAP